MFRVPRFLKICIRMFFRPVGTIEDISIEPEYLSPLLYLLILVLLTWLYVYLYTNRIVIVTPRGEISLWEYEVQPRLSALLATRVLGLMTMWFILFGLYYLVGKIMGSEEEIATLFPLSGMSYHIQIVYMVLDLTILSCCLTTVPIIKVSGLMSSNFTISSSYAVNILLWSTSPKFPHIRSLYEWFFPLWGAVYNIMVMRIDRGLDLKSAIIGGSLVSATMALIHIILTLLGFPM